MTQQATTTNAARNAGQTVVFFALSAYGWGKSDTAEKARRLCQSNSPNGKRPAIKVYRCHPSTELQANGMEWTWDKGAPRPELVS